MKKSTVLTFYLVANYYCANSDTMMKIAAALLLLILSNQLASLEASQLRFPCRSDEKQGFPLSSLSNPRRCPFLWEERQGHISPSNSPPTTSSSNNLRGLAVSSHARKLNGTEDDEEENLPYIVIPDGVWTNRFNGEALVAPSRATPNVTGSFDYFSETEISCVMEWENGTMEVLYLEDGWLSELSEDGTQILVTEWLTEILWHFSPNGFEAGCRAGVSPSVEDEDYFRDPVFAYAVFRQWFLEQYPFFLLRFPGGYDAWFNFSDSLAGMVDANTTDEELFDIMVQAIRPLNDGFANLHSDFATFENPLQPFSQELNDECDEILAAAADGNGSLRRRLDEEGEEEVDTEQDDYFEDTEPDAYTLYRISQLELWYDVIQSKYLDTINGTVMDALFYGTVLDEDGSSCIMGYIQYMTFYPDDDDAWRQNLMAAHASLKNCSSVLADIRINDGGYDHFALEAASYFATANTHVFSKRTMLRNATDGSERYTLYQDIYMVPPDDSNLIYDNGPVVVLMSGSTTGAGEVYAMAMKTLGFPMIGQPTVGLFSDTWYYVLPNGWFVVLGTEEYIWSQDGKLYEEIGFPVDVALTRPCPQADELVPEDEASTIATATTATTTCKYMSPLPLSERQQGVDTWLEQAIDYTMSLIAAQDTIPPTTGTPTSTPAPTTGTPTTNPTNHARAFGTTFAVALTVISLTMAFLAI